MAGKKKVTTTVEEEVIETPEEEIDYKDIHNKSDAEIAADQVKETPKEEEVVEEEKKEEEPAFDPEAFKKEAADEIKQGIMDALQGNKEDKEEKVDEYEEWAKKVFKETGEQPNWKQAAEFIKEQAKTELRAEQEKATQEAKTEQEKVTQAQKVESDRVNDYVDEQLKDLYAANKMPRVKNAEDPNDLGLTVRKALMEQTIKVNKERIDKGLPTKTLKEVFYEDFKSPNRQQAGANAPVSLGHGATSHDNEQEIDYVRDVKGGNTVLDKLMRRWR